MAVLLKVPFITQLGIGSHARGTPGRDDLTGCWYASVSVTCQSGVCSAQAQRCAGPDGDADCAESCDAVGKTCKAPDPEQSPCSDGNPQTSVDLCIESVCVGTALACGDATGDGRITANDALKVLRAAVGVGFCPLSLCDFNGDGFVRASDAQAILRRSVGQPIEGNCPTAESTRSDTGYPVNSTSTSVTSTSSTSVPQR